MLIRLTTPEAFDKLIEYLEKEHHLQWPDIHFSDGSDYRSYFIGQIKEEMKNDIVIVEVDWAYSFEKHNIVANMKKILYSEINTDMGYLEKDPTVMMH